ncbi:MAG: prepilin peptidase [Candidatus Omnitrophica bacterium]|nr:prepilin peptidase [Candidatus Omnitrophota bacterium]
MDSLFSFFRPAASLLFLFIGVYCCYTDLKYRKIKNFLILAGVLSAFFFFILLKPKLISNKDFFLNFALAALAGFSFWRLHLWAAGDAKFFILSSLFICIISPKEGFLHAPFKLPVVLALLLNSFILGFIFIFVEALLNFIQEIIHCFHDESKISFYKKRFSAFFNRKALIDLLKIIFFYIATIIVFMSIKNNLQRLLDLSGGYQLVLYLVLVIFYNRLRHSLENTKAVYLAILLTILVIFSKFDIILIIKFSMKFFIVLAAIRFVIGFLGNKAQLKTIRTENLKINQLLSADEIMSLPDEIKKEITFFADGLTATQALSLKKYYRSKKKFTVDINKTFPFVLFIFFSVIFTHFLKGGLVNPLFFLF